MPEIPFDVFKSESVYRSDCDDDILEMDVQFIMESLGEAQEKFGVPGGFLYLY